jgi:hypothetical protein
MINRNQIYNQGSNNIRIQSSKNPQVSQVSKSKINPFTSNIQINNRNINNNNQNLNMNMNKNRNNQYDIVGKAFLLIRNELRKKDDRIIQLEKKVEELTKKLNLLTNINNNNISSSVNPFGNSTKKENKEVQERNMINNIGGNIRPDGYNFRYANLNIGDMSQRNSNYVRSISHNIPNYNSDSENIVKRFQKYDNLSHSHENSIKTYNGAYYNSKTEVKNYLRSVKNILEPKKFKEFIKNIKMLTDKSNSTFNKNIIVENVRIIFGEEHKDFFIRFKTIIGGR